MSLENFPRGEKKSEIKRSADGLFEKKRESEEHMTEEEIQFIKHNAKQRLPQKVVHREGPICLGRVSRIEHEYLEVSLPSGRGYVKNVDVSKSYRRLLPKEITSKRIIQNECYPLSDLFKPGDYVVCCSKATDKIYSDQTGFLSMEPQLINLSVRPNDLVKGFKIIVSVKSIEDHGYIVDTGILNVTAFLATENSEQGKQYLPNTQLLCTVKEVETVGHTTVVKLSTKEEKPISVDDDDVVSSDVLMPGTKFSLRVKTLSDNCVKLYFGKDIEGYIHQLNLKHPLSTYKPDTYVTGTFLYIWLYARPVKLARFSELDDTFSEKEKLRVGDIIEKAEVLYRDTEGAVFKLSESGVRGYVHFRITNVPIEEIETVFKEGSVHKCRVVRYDWIEYLYVCTIDEISIWNGDECDIVPKSASEHVTKPPTENKQELCRKRNSESHDVDLANPPKKALEEVPKKANDVNVHAKVRKTEFEKIIEKVIGKFRQNRMSSIQTWIKCCPALLKNDIKEKLCQSTQRALESLVESHVTSIVC